MSVPSRPDRALRAALEWLVSRLVTFYLRTRGVRVGARCSFFGIPAVRRARGAAIRIGDAVVIRSGSATNPFSAGSPTVMAAVKPGAVLAIGDGVRISDAVIVCGERLAIGSGTYVGVGALVTDTDAHAVCAECRDERAAAASAPVEIGARCFLGARSIVLKGARLAEGTCVGAGSVVTAGETSGVLAGNPARQVRESARCAAHSPSDIGSSPA